MKENKFIRLPISDSSQTKEAFIDLMGKTEDILNTDFELIGVRPTASEIEKITLKAIRKATDTLICFKADDISLISGFQFPDIEIKPCYGVEVKTSKNGWSSIGSSIIESTRIPEVEEIYMVFGNLENLPPKFMCRPYEKVLTDIKVTHSPRYLIDMNTDSTVFNAMGIEYNKFRKLDDKEKIELAQKHARKKLLDKGLKEMPWWVKNLKDDGVEGNIRIWNSLSQDEKKLFTAQCMLLFPSVLSPFPNPTKYNEATLWLCSYHHIVTPNIRDLFSAGGQVTFRWNKKKEFLIPAIYVKIRSLKNEIKKLLQSRSDEFEMQLGIYNPGLCEIEPDKRFHDWINWLSARNPLVPIKEYILQ